MATLRQNEIADRMIRDIPRMNNQALGAVDRLLGIRTEFNGLPQADKDAVLAIMASRELEVGEYTEMFDDWLAAKAEMDARGIVKKDVPR